jgi:hypothetical protein
VAAVRAWIGAPEGRRSSHQRGLRSSLEARECAMSERPRCQWTSSSRWEITMRRLGWYQAWLFRRRRVPAYVGSWGCSCSRSRASPSVDGEPNGFGCPTVGARLAGGSLSPAVVARPQQPGGLLSWVCPCLCILYLVAAKQAHGCWSQPPVRSMMHLDRPKEEESDAQANRILCCTMRCLPRWAGAPPGYRRLLRLARVRGQRKSTALSGRRRYNVQGLTLCVLD